MMVTVITMVSRSSSAGTGRHKMDLGLALDLDLAYLLTVLCRRGGPRHPPAPTLIDQIRCAGVPAAPGGAPSLKR
jgi:hypothetical protein